MKKVFLSRTHISKRSQLMSQTAESVSLLDELGYFRDVIKFQGNLSDLVIPSVPGEYYVYSSVFTKERPLYTLGKCKANKNRPIAAIKNLGRQANLFFFFNNSNPVQICAVRTACDSDLLSVDSGLFGETRIASTKITVDEFYKLCLQKNTVRLVDVCKSACSKCDTFITLKLGTVIAMITDDDKYGLFLVKNLTRTSIHVDACHILL